MPCTREASPHGAGCIRWFGLAGQQPAPTELTQISKKGAPSACKILTCFAFLEKYNFLWRKGELCCQSEQSLHHLKRQDNLILLLICLLLCSIFVKPHRNDGDKKSIYFQFGRALRGTKTKVIKRVLPESQQESGDATYSMSLSYARHVREKSDKQRA